LVDQAKTEYGLKAIESLMEEIGKEDPNLQIPLAVIQELIVEADQII